MAIPTQPNYKLAESKAYEFVSGYSSPPISPLDVASKLGLNVIEVEMPEEYSSVAGFLDLENKTITVNKADPLNRQTFTIAHEIGHYVLHQKVIHDYPDEYKILFRNPDLNVKTPLEKEANCFAASLLVPINLLEKYKDLPDSALALLFQVSQEVISHRRKTLWHQNLGHL